MKWHEIRKQYPEQFVLVEALKAYSRDNKRYIDDMTVVDCYEDTKKAWEDYKKYRLETPTREFYILHTSKEKFEVQQKVNFCNFEGGVCYGK